MNASVWLKPLEGLPFVNSPAKNALSQNLFALDTLKSLKTGPVTAGHVKPVWNLFHRDLTSNVEDFVSI